jgi:hypothetical protein
VDTGPVLVPTLVGRLRLDRLINQVVDLSRGSGSVARPYDSELRVCHGGGWSCIEYAVILFSGPIEAALGR